MTLEEAIIHCKEKSCGNTQCALEHRQLAEWLQELQEYRKNARKKTVYMNESLDKEIIRYKVPFQDDDENLDERTLDAIAHHFYNLALEDVRKAVTERKSELYRLYIKGTITKYQEGQHDFAVDVRDYIDNLMK